MVCKLYGFPQSLVSDRDPIFVGRFWCELFTISGTELCMSISYPLEIDGQTEVLNHTLEQYLSCFVHDALTKWFLYLPLAEWCYNTFVPSTTGMTPFEATYGKAPLSITTYIPGSSQVEAIDNMLTTRQDLWTLLIARFQKA